MKSKDKQIREYSSNLIPSLSAFIVALIIIIALFAVLVFYDNIKINKLESQLQSYQEKVPVAEVINGNLYVGYEDGVRVGYHNFNGTWYRCVKNCEVLE